MKLDIELAKDFEAFINGELSTDPIGVGHSPSELTGHGTEYLLDDYNNVLAKFFNGNIIGPALAGSSEVTKV